MLKINAGRNDPPEWAESTHTLKRAEMTQANMTQQKWLGTEMTLGPNRPKAETTRYPFERVLEQT